MSSVTGGSTVDRTIFIGVDFGQQVNHSAIVVLDRFDEKPEYTDMLRGGDDVARALCCGAGWDRVGRAGGRVDACGWDGVQDVAGGDYSGAGGDGVACSEGAVIDEDAGDGAAGAVGDCGGVRAS